MKIGNKIIGESTYVIAEFGVNHNNSLARAKEGIIKAKQAGADAIKFQLYKADDLVVKATPKFWHWQGDRMKDQHEAYKDLEKLPWESYRELKALCDLNQIEFLCTPFSFEAADFLHSLGMNAFKVSSSDLCNLPFLEHIAKFQKPILLSTGAATLEEISEAIETINKAGNNEIVLLHCTLCYPTATQDANLNVMQTLADKFNLPVGVSDHTLGALPGVVASAMGAAVVEKHFTVDKTLPESADHWLSLDPKELTTMVNYIRYAEILKGSAEKNILECEKETRVYDKRSIVTAKYLAKGDVVTEAHLTYKRPGTGIKPKERDQLIGKVANEFIIPDTTLQWEMFK